MDRKNGMGPEAWAEDIAALLESFCLSDRELRFVTAYLACGNGREAARQAGYAGTGKEASRDLKRRPAVRAAIAAAQRAVSARLMVQSEQINGALAEIGFADAFAVKNAINQGGSVDEILKRLRALEPWQLACIKSMTVNRTHQSLTVTYASATDALKALSQNLGLSRGAQDKDQVFLVFEEIHKEEEIREEAGVGMVSIGPGLEADFSISAGEIEPREAG